MMRNFIFFMVAISVNMAYAADEVLDYRVFWRPDTEENRKIIEDAVIFKNIGVFCLNKLMKLPHKPRTILDSEFVDETYCNQFTDMDFSCWKFRNVLLRDWGKLENLNFSGADFDGGYYELLGDNINLTDAAFRNCGLRTFDENFMQTQTYRERTTDSLSLGLAVRKSCHKDLDLSGLHFQSLSGMGLDCRADNLSFSELGLFTTEHAFYQALTPERMCTTANYKLGFFRDSCWAGPEVPADMKKVCFVNSKFGINPQYLEYYPNAASDVKHVDFEDAMFIECEIYPNAMTLDQIKQTWNYKTGRMDLITLPPELQEQVDAELAKVLTP